MTFRTSQGSAATVYRWGGQIFYYLMSNFTRILFIKNHRNWMVFDGVIQKIICGRFLRHSVVTKKTHQSRWLFLMHVIYLLLMNIVKSYSASHMIQRSCTVNPWVQAGWSLNTGRAGLKYKPEVWLDCTNRRWDLNISRVSEVGESTF